MSAPEPVARYSAVSCDFCGDSPVNHFFAYVDGTVTVGANNLAQHKLVTFILSLFSKPLRYFEHFYFWLFSKLGEDALSADVERAPSFRSRVIWLEAKRRGIPMEQFMILGLATDWYRAKVAGKWRYFQSLPIPPQLIRDDEYWVDDKNLLKKKLRAENVPVPLSESASTEKEALAVFQALNGGPVIVKPRSGSRGRHTSTFITKEEDFLTAFRRAKMVNRYVQIEEHLKGNVCRATVVAGKLRGFLKGEPPKITGDGKKTVRELIEEKNKNKPDRISDVVIKSELIECVRRQGYELDSVVPEGLTIQLLFRTGRLFGGKTEEMLSRIHPKLVSYVEKAGGIVGLPIVGFDLIIEHPEQDPDIQKWGIIEANTLPFIDLHDYAFKGEPANVAAHVWDLWSTTR